MRVLLFCILFLSFRANGQDLAKIELPRITDTIASIQSAKGWIKNETGDWISKDNAILYKERDIKYNCIDFIEYSLLKIGYKNKRYFCLLRKAKGRDYFWIFDYFEKYNSQLNDTNVCSKFKITANRTIYSVMKNQTDFINEFYQSFVDDDFLYEVDDLFLSIIINKSKNSIRFLFFDKYTDKCGDDINSIDKTYFETDLKDLPFFQNLIVNR